jgi:hypothetical protein
MERVDTLIKRLLEQQASNADASSMLLTAQMLVHELQERGTETATGKKVSVIHPGIKNTAIQTDRTTVTVPVVEKAEAVPQPVAAVQKPQEEPKPEPVRAFAPIAKIEEIPTFAYQHKEAFDLNDRISTGNEQTLNERLKTGKKELGSLLKESPVKDLKKAIGINDRFVFIEELFRGDENMYERSIKTINGFSIFPEAEYWIQRELKTKIGWDEESPAVQHFDQLVRRRFS